VSTLWAPIPTRIDLVVDGERTPLAKISDTEWQVPELAPGTDYGFSIDGEDSVLPDPRSRRQPEGVHGPSRTVDLDAFAWTDSAWPGRALAGGVIYELHIGTFTPTGTLDSAIEKLDYLVDLGIDFVEVLPVNAFNGTHNWGYDGVLWYAVDESYGGPEAFQRFVDACHARGLGVIQDVVYNHLGPSGNYLPRFGPIFSETSNTWGASVNLADEHVRRYILENALSWMRDFHVDGLRLDAVHALVDNSPVHLLAQLASETTALEAELGRPLILIAESDLNDPKLITPPDQSTHKATGYGLTAQWSDDYHHALHVALTGETTGYYEDFASLEALAKTSTKGFFHDGTYSSFRESDHGYPVDESMPTWRLVTFAQDHDQIGNRATGDRLAATLSADRLAVGAVLTLAAPYTPMLFMGEEWGASTPWQFFTSHPEPELGEATAKGRIAEFEKMGWDPDVVPNPQDLETFTNSKLDWSELETGDHARLLETYRSLIALRRSVPELTDERFDQLSSSFDDATGWFRLDRGGVSVLANLGEAATTLPVAGEVLFDTSDATQQTAGEITLAPNSAVILRRS